MGIAAVVALVLGLGAAVLGFYLLSARQSDPVQPRVIAVPAPAAPVAAPPAAK